MLGDVPTAEWPNTPRSGGSSPDRRCSSGFENWCYTDREIVEHHLDRLDVQTFYLPDTEDYGPLTDTRRGVQSRPSTETVARASLRSKVTGEHPAHWTRKILDDSVSHGRRHNELEGRVVAD